MSGGVPPSNKFEGSGWYFINKAAPSLQINGTPVIFPDFQDSSQVQFFLNAVTGAIQLASSGGGTTWYFGVGIPSSSLGTAGDFYLDTSTGNTYNKGAGIWSFIGTLIGPIGPAGPTGPPGPTPSGAQNLVLATPNGTSGLSSLCSLVAADIPSLDASKIITGALALARGGTGVDLSASGGITYVLAQDVSHVISARALVSGDIPNNAANTTGSAAKWTTARNLAGNSVDGSANVVFANKFIVQGTVDSGLSGPQFLGALGTGVLKNTTTTGVLSIAVGSDLPTGIPIGSVGSAGLSGSAPLSVASTGVISIAAATSLAEGIIQLTSDLGNTAASPQVVSTHLASPLPLIQGGTASDLSATGGASQVLKQVSFGAVITVGQLAASDLSNGTTGSGAVVLAGGPTFTSVGSSVQIATTGNGNTNSLQFNSKTTLGAAFQFAIGTQFTTDDAIQIYDVTNSQLVYSYTPVGAGSHQYWIKGTQYLGLDPGKLSCGIPISIKQYTVAALPSGSESFVAYATNGLKVGELSGAGTGVPVYYSNGQWRVFSKDVAVAA